MYRASPTLRPQGPPHSLTERAVHQQNPPWGCLDSCKAAKSQCHLRRLTGLCDGKSFLLLPRDSREEAQTPLDSSTSERYTVPVESVTVNKVTQVSDWDPNVDNIDFQLPQQTATVGSTFSGRNLGLSFSLVHCWRPSWLQSQLVWILRVSHTCQAWNLLSCKGWRRLPG